MGRIAGTGARGRWAAARLSRTRVAAVFHSERAGAREGCEQPERARSREFDTEHGLAITEADVVRPGRTIRRALPTQQFEHPLHGERVVSVDRRGGDTQIYRAQR